jgi:integrase
VVALRTWLPDSGLETGHLFRKVNRGGKVEKQRLNADAVRQILADQAGLKSKWYEALSPHSMRAGFTTAYRDGVPDEDIMGPRHRSPNTMRSYVRRAKLSPSSPAGKIGL